MIQYLIFFFKNQLHKLSIIIINLNQHYIIKILLFLIKIINILKESIILIIIWEEIKLMIELKCCQVNYWFNILEFYSNTVSIKY
jgi:hypothetical protein